MDVFVIIKPTIDVMLMDTALNDFMSQNDGLSRTMLDIMPISGGCWNRDLKTYCLQRSLVKAVRLNLSTGVYRQVSRNIAGISAQWSTVNGTGL